MKTEVDLCGIKMKNPVTVASGTFGYGREYSQYIDLNKLGGIITKGTSLKLRSSWWNVKQYRTSKSRCRIFC